MEKSKQNDISCQSKIDGLKEEIKTLKSVNKIALHDLKEKEISVEETRISNIRFQTIFEKSAVGNKIIDADLRILQVNDALVKLLGYSKEELLGAYIIDFSHPDYKQNWQLLQDKLWKRRMPSFSIDTCLTKKNGLHIWCNVTSIIFDDNEETLGFTIVTDISDRIELEKHRDEADAKRDAFINLMSYEIKTALTNIKNYVQLLAKSIAPKESVYPLIEKTSKHVKHLERLISDLLDITKIKSGREELVLSWFNVQDVLKESIQSVQYLSPRHNIILENAVKILYRGDQFRVEQVLINLLKNAIKYSPEADKIIVNSKRELDNIIISVQDFGIGIDEKDMGKLFDRFFRVEKSAMNYQGMGLGLYIASEILAHHKGAFWVESQLGKGSTFFFRLPIDRTKERRLIETKKLYKNEHICIAYKKESTCVEVAWLGFQNQDSIKNGCLTILKIVEENKCNKVLIDNTHVLGSWSDAAQWIGMEWFPMMEEAGLKHLAWINSPSTFSQLSLYETVDAKVGNVETSLFRIAEDAKSWLAGIN